jgi:hypothetical protein
MTTKVVGGEPEQGAGGRLGTEVAAVDGLNQQDRAGDDGQPTERPPPPALSGQGNGNRQSGARRIFAASSVTAAGSQRFPRCVDFGVPRSSYG